jgi:hypothetical protein
MSRLFQAYVAVDWSAAAKPVTGPDSIWIGVMKRNVRFQMAFKAHNPATRMDAENQLEAILADLGRKHERTLLGFDFPFGFPRGTAAALKLTDPTWRGMLDFLTKEVKDKKDNANNRFQVGAKMNRLMTGEAFPFWGAPARDEQTMLSAKRPREHREGDLPEFRYADQAMKGAASIWKLYYQGSIGGQAMTGLPVLARMKAKRGEAMKIWPFELGWKPLTIDALEGVEIVAAEIDPGQKNASAPTGIAKDAARVYACVERFAALDEKGRLGALFGPAKEDPRRDDVEREEGWALEASF